MMHATITSSQIKFVNDSDNSKKKSKNSEAPIGPRLHKHSGVFHSHLV